MTGLDVKKLTDKFHCDIENICLEQIKCFSLKFNQDVPNLSSPLSRWLDFRMRYIDPIPRRVMFSDQFRNKRMQEHAKQALKKIVRGIKLGKDINPYQGRGLIIRNDFSGEDRTKRTDLLWASWGIHHLHLSNVPIPATQYFSKPADYLAYCIVSSDVIAFIDVLKHPDIKGFSNPDLIKTVQRNWPEYMNSFKLNGAIGSSEGDHNQDDIHKLRSAGINPNITINGDVYMGPGLGITSANTPLRINMAEMNIVHAIKLLAEIVVDPNGTFRTPSMNNSNKKFDFSIVGTPEGLSVYEASIGVAFLLPLYNSKYEPSVLDYLHDMVFPVWSRTQLFNKIL